MRSKKMAMRRGFAGLAAVAACAGALALAAGAQASTPIETFTAIPSTTQAGGHPDLEVQFSLKNRVVQESHSACNCEDARNITAHLPTGFIGAPHATPQCTLAEFSANQCAIDSQVGIAEVVATNALPGNAGFLSIIYNLVPPPGEAGLLGFKLFFLNTPVYTVLSGRTGSDYGLDVTTRSVYHGESPLQSLRQVLWGVPAAPSHDLLRFDPELNTNSPGATSYIAALCDANGALSNANPNSVVKPCYYNYMTLPPVRSNSPENPFQDNPTTCGAPLTATLEVLSYDGETTEANYPWPEMSGCDQLSFNPSLYARPTTTAADSASGADVFLQVPQPQSAAVPSPSELRGAKVTLPVGFSINPNAADGKAICSDAEGLIGPFASEAEAHCPDFSKVGSLTIEDPALPGPLPGYVYLGEPQPGNRYRIFLVANGFATHVKLSGIVTPDPATGQLTITFENLPQNPLAAFNMHFFGSQSGLLATPTQCGTYPVTSVFTPWDSSLPPQTSTQYFNIESGPNGSPCPGSTRPFNPHFTGGVKIANAGVHSPFAVEITRADGDQNLSQITIATPPGFTATLRGVAYCPDAALAKAEQGGYSGLAEEASPSCPSSSQVGVSTAGSGAGTHPVYLPGKVYLAGPYKGAPLSLAVVTPVVSGPYDLGNIVVRVALHVDSETAQITAVSDSIPQIFEGIPLRLRSVIVELDRPGFSLNPTDCNQFAVNATIAGSESGAAGLASSFQVANCAGLPFQPKLSLKLTGALGRRGHPGVHAVLRTQPGEADPSMLAVTLPPSELLDNSHFGTVCTRPAFAAEQCPPGARLGSAEVTSPLLERPLIGSAYLRSSTGGLPNLALSLNGQIHIDAIARIDAVNGGLRTTFQTIPDVPLGTVVLDLKGGSKGLIQNSEPLCGSQRNASVVMHGQNGKRLSRQLPLELACTGSSSSSKHHRLSIAPRDPRNSR